MRATVPSSATVSGAAAKPILPAIKSWGGAGSSVQPRLRQGGTPPGTTATTGTRPIANRRNRRGSMATPASARPRRAPIRLAVPGRPSSPTPRSTRGAPLRAASRAHCRQLESGSGEMRAGVSTPVRRGLPESDPVRFDLRVPQPIHDPSERRRVARDHVAHGPIIPRDHLVQFGLRNQPQRSRNRLLETLSGLPEGNEIVAPDRVEQDGIGEGGLAGRGRRDHGGGVVVARDPVLVRRQPPGVPEAAMQVVQDLKLFPEGPLGRERRDAADAERPVRQVVGDVRRDSAGDAGLHGRARASLDPYARRHIGGVAAGIEGGIRHQECLSAGVVRVGLNGVSPRQPADCRLQARVSSSNSTPLRRFQ